MERYCRKGRLSDALKCLHLMDQRGIWPSISLYGLLLQECARQKALAEGRRIHSHMIANKSDCYTFLGNNLIRMYAVCGALAEARQVFDMVEKRNVFTWTAMISGYADGGHGEDALELFHQMQEDEIKPDKFLYTILLDVCGRVGALEEGRRVHTMLVGDGLRSDMVVGTALVSMYARCGRIDFARKVFNKMRVRDVVTWSAIIHGYAQLGHGAEALALFRQMQEDQVQPNSFTFVSVLSACASVPALEEGKKVHTMVVERSEFDGNPVVGNALVNMYAKCGSVDTAREVFDGMEKRDGDSWTTMINGYAQAGRGADAVALYKEMKQAGVKTGVVTYACLLHALKGLDEAGEDDDGTSEQKLVHQDIAEAGMESDPVVAAALIDCHVRAGRMDRARAVFDKVGDGKELASWNAMMCGYLAQGRAEQVLELYQRLLLLQEGRKPDAVTFVAALNACAGMAALRRGRAVHDLASQTGLLAAGDVAVQGALVDMYAKNGDLAAAVEVFSGMQRKDVVAWTAVISGHAIHGQGEEAVALFEEMKQEAGVTPSVETLDAVLQAYAHAAAAGAEMVDAGLAHFKSMRQDHGVVPTAERCACVVRILGRAGRLEHAEAFLGAWPAPDPPTPDHFMLLLAACARHGNLEVAERVAPPLLDSPRHRGAALRVLVGIYRAAGRGEEGDARYGAALLVEGAAAEKPTGKQQAGGRCWVEVGNEVQSLASGDTSHPLAKQVRRRAAALYARVQRLDPDLSAPAAARGDCYHSELLAVALAQMKTTDPPGSPLRFMKNLRLCSHCHDVLKLASQLLKRDIIARDANRFHHFQAGSCSCADYW